MSTQAPDRPADVVTLMWEHDDDTITTETTDFRTTPRTVTTRVWNDVSLDSLAALAEDSTVIPDEVSL